MTGTPATPAAPPPQTPPAEYPATCEIRDWQVFTNGVHKGDLYTPADVDQIAANFAPVSKSMTPYMGLGHDKQQRVAASLGLPNAGHVTGCRSDGRGNLFLDLANVPTWVGAKIEAKGYHSGSVELKRDFPPPDDPARPIPGRYLDGIALLGEEQPAVKGCTPPRAVFADGTPVPPNHDPVPVPKALLSALSPPRPVAGAHSVCFSQDFPTEAAPVTLDEIVAALKALPPEQQKLALDQCQPAAAVPPAVPPVVPDKPPGAAMSAEEMSACVKKLSEENDDLKKRFSAYEAAKSEEQKKADEGQMAAFSADFDRIFDRNDNARRVTPFERGEMKKVALDLAGRKAFSADVTPTKYLQDVEARVAALPVNPLLKNEPAPAAGAKPARPQPSNPKVIAGLASVAPNSYARLSGAAG